jgi:tRNA pseudouridine38-40 synthase
MAVAYDGTAYCGFQTQPGKNTIQDKIEEALRMLTGEEIRIIGSGRTDSGVHARGQVFNFYTQSSIPIERWCLALNSRLPEDIVVYKAKEVSPEFHARKSAKRKTYRYTIANSKFADVMRRKYQYHHPRELNVEAMRAGLQQLIGEHDFTSFCSRKSVQLSHVRTIYDAFIETEPLTMPWADSSDRIIHVTITGNGFLYQMVRIIVGTLLEVGEGKRTAGEMAEILRAKDRLKAGPTAMPHGLMLWSVVYDEFHS